MNALRFRSLSLLHDDVQDAILQARCHRILVDVGWEAEAAMELANAAFRQPKVGMAAVSPLGLLVALLLSDLMVVGALRLVFDSRLVGFAIRIVVGPLNTTLDGDGLRVGKAEVDVLLLEAWELAVQVVCIGVFVSIEPRPESTESVILLAGTVCVVVVEKAEERRKVGMRERLENRHVD